MLFLTPKQIKALGRLNTEDVESFVVEIEGTSMVLTTVWGYDGKARQYSIDTLGKTKEIKQNA